MPSKVLWSAYGTFTTAIDGVTAAPTLKNLANGGRVLGGVIDNTATHDQYADWQLKIKFAVAPAVGAVVEVHFVLSIDGTNYADGDASTTPASAPAMILPVRNVATAQVIAVPYVLLPAGKFKPLFVNTGGQALTNVDSDNVLSYRPYDDEGQ